MGYLNQDKFERARDVVSGKRKFEGESAEARALVMGREKGLKDEELVEFIYDTLGGARTEVPVKKEIQTGVIKEEKIGKEVEEVKPKRAKK